MSQPQDQQELDIELINANNKAIAEDLANKQKAKRWETWVRAVLIALIFIPAFIEYGWSVIDFAGWFSIIGWAIVLVFCWLMGKIAYAIVRK